MFFNWIHFLWLCISSIYIYYIQLLPESPKLQPIKLEVKILAYERTTSLQRLLDSLKSAFYPENSYINLTILIDKSSKQKEIIEIVRQFNWSYGTKSVFPRHEQAGLVKQWMESWYPISDDEYALILEDDLELSPFYYDYLIFAIHKFGNNPHIFGICLHKLHHSLGMNEWKKTIKPKKFPDLFLFPAIGTWGQLLFPKPFRQFREWTNNFKKEEMIHGLITASWELKKKKTLFTNLFDRWLMSTTYYNLYRGGDSLSVSHREDGLNFKNVSAPDSNLLTDQIPNWRQLKNPATYNICYDKILYPKVYTRADFSQNSFYEFIVLCDLKGQLVIEQIKNWKCWIDLHRFPVVLFIVKTKNNAELLVQNGLAALIEEDFQETITVLLRNHKTVLMTNPNNIWFNDPFPWLFLQLINTKVASIWHKSLPFIYIPPSATILLNLPEILHSLKSQKPHQLITWIDRKDWFPDLRGLQFVESFTLIGIGNGKKKYWGMYGDLACKKVDCPYVDFHQRLGVNEKDIK